MPTPTRPVLVLNGVPTRYSAYTVYNDQLHITRQITATERRTERYQVISFSMVQPPLWLTDGTRRRRTQLRLQVQPLIREPRLPMRLNSQHMQIVQEHTPRCMTVLDEQVVRALQESARRTREIIDEMASVIALSAIRDAPSFGGRERPATPLKILYYPRPDSRPVSLIAAGGRLMPDEEIWTAIRPILTPAPALPPPPPFPAIIKDAVEYYRTLAYDAEQAGNHVQAEAWRQVARSLLRMDGAAFGRWYITTGHPRKV